MKVLDTKLRHHTAVLTGGSLSPFALIEHASFNVDDVNQKNEIYALANNPATSPTLLDYISMTDAVIVSESVAGNVNASKVTLQRLASHDNYQVRAAVTENPNAPFEILVCLCEDQHPDVRFMMAENPRVPKSLLTKLSNDDNPYVAARACNTLERLGIDATNYCH